MKQCSKVLGCVHACRRVLFLILCGYEKTSIPAGAGWEVALGKAPWIQQLMQLVHSMGK